MNSSTSSRATRLKSSGSRARCDFGVETSSPESARSCSLPREQIDLRKLGEVRGGGRRVSTSRPKRTWRGLPRVRPGRSAPDRRKPARLTASSRSRGAGKESWRSRRMMLPSHSTRATPARYRPSSIRMCAPNAFMPMRHSNGDGRQQSAPPDRSLRAPQATRTRPLRRSLACRRPCARPGSCVEADGIKRDSAAGIGRVAYA